MLRNPPSKEPKKPEVDVYVELDVGPALDFEPEVLKDAIARAIQLTGGKLKGSTASLSDKMEVSLLITGDERIRELNREYRHLDQPTDVLSFSQVEGDTSFITVRQDVVNLGDIVISIETARRQAVEQRHSVEQEMAHLALHGTLHLLGYDHQTDEEEAEMNALEHSVLEQLKREE